MVQYSMVQLLLPQAMESSLRRRLGFTHSVYNIFAVNVTTMTTVNPLQVLMFCTLPRGGMYWAVYPRRPRDFLRPERRPKSPRDISTLQDLEVGGDVQPIHPNSRQCTAILSSLIHPWGCINKYTYTPIGRLVWQLKSKPPC